MLLDASCSGARWFCQPRSCIRPLTHRTKLRRHYRCEALHQRSCAPPLVFGEHPSLQPTATMPKPQKKRQHVATEEPVKEGLARDKLDDKGREDIKRRLTTASDALIVTQEGKEASRCIDEAVAFVHMGAYVKARGSLLLAKKCFEDEAFLTKFGQQQHSIDEVLRELPANDAKVETEPVEQSEDEVGRFDQEPHSTDCTMVLEVPASTSTEDVKVVIKRDFLSVHVKGHKKQPHVLYGYLSGNVEVDACAWTLDGNELVINLEKETDHPCWPKLLKEPVNYWEDSRGLEGDLSHLNLAPDETTAKVWVSRDEAIELAGKEERQQ